MINISVDPTFDSIVNHTSYCFKIRISYFIQFSQYYNHFLYYLLNKQSYMVYNIAKSVKIQLHINKN